jgi:hypothetical protein
MHVLGLTVAAEKNDSMIGTRRSVPRVALPQELRHA